MVDKICANILEDNLIRNSALLSVFASISFHSVICLQVVNNEKKVLKMFFLKNVCD